MRFLLLTFLMLPGVRAANAQNTTLARPARQIVRIATESGVVGDGTTLNTAALQSLIDACSAAGGGTIKLPAGKYVTGTIQLKDNITLHLDEGATLQGSRNPADYRNLDPFMAGDGYPLGHAMLVAIDAKNVTIEGRGTIDGQGKELHAAQPVEMRQKIRPFLMRWIRCSNITLRDVQLQNAGAWCLHLFQSQDIALERLTIRNRGLFNNDGIDIDSSRNVTIRDCDIDSGDDAICLKATSPLPTRNIRVSACKLSTSCNGLKLGTESLGDFEDVQIRNCQLRNIGMAGVAIYSVDGAHIQRVNISDVTMDDVAVPISMRLGARLKTFRPSDKPRLPGIMRDVTIKSVRVTRARQIGILINGIPGHRVESLTLEDINIDLPGGSTEDAADRLPEKEAAYPEMSMFGPKMPVYGMYARHIKEMKLRRVEFKVAKPDLRPSTWFEDIEGAASF